GRHARRDVRRAPAARAPAPPRHLRLAGVDGAVGRGVRPAAGAVPRGLPRAAGPPRGGRDDREPGVPGRAAGVLQKARVSAGGLARGSEPGVCGPRKGSDGVHDDEWAVRVHGHGLAQDLVRRRRAAAHHSPDARAQRPLRRGAQPRRRAVLHAHPWPRQVGRVRREQPHAVLRGAGALSRGRRRVPGLVGSVASTSKSHPRVS
ncbi:unnamed protein product, partial [Mycena citricolor]